MTNLSEAIDSSEPPSLLWSNAMHSHDHIKVKVDSEVDLSEEKTILEIKSNDPSTSFSLLLAFSKYSPQGNPLNRISTFLTMQDYINLRNTCHEMHGPVKLLHYSTEYPKCIWRGFVKAYDKVQFSWHLDCYKSLVQKYDDQMSRSNNYRESAVACSKWSIGGTIYLTTVLPLSVVSTISMGAISMSLGILGFFAGGMKEAINSCKKRNTKPSLRIEPPTEYKKR